MIVTISKLTVDRIVTKVLEVLKLLGTYDVKVDECDRYVTLIIDKPCDVNTAFRVINLFRAYVTQCEVGEREIICLPCKDDTFTIVIRW